MLEYEYINSRNKALMFFLIVFGFLFFTIFQAYASSYEAAGNQLEDIPAEQSKTSGHHSKMETPLHAAVIFGAGILNAPAALKTVEYTAMGIPAADTGHKAWMSYQAITAKGSIQYKLQQEAYTDENGFRRIGDDYLVAMGTYYGRTCGMRFRITLESGAVFYAMLGDIKSDVHTDPLNQHSRGNVIEFLVDEKLISAECRRMGDMSHAEDGRFRGKIAAIDVISEI